MYPSSAAQFLTGAFTDTATAPIGPGPQVTELVRIRPNAHDSSWPPVLIFCVAVVVVGGLIAALVFLRNARDAARPVRRPLDG